MPGAAGSGLPEAIEAVDQTLRHFPAIGELRLTRSCCRSDCLLSWLALDPGGLNEAVLQGVNHRRRFIAAKGATWFVTPLVFTHLPKASAS